MGTGRPTEEQVKSALEAALASSILQRSSKSRHLLAYLVTQALRGEGGSIKSYTIGVDVLGKPEDFDPATDASVRVAVGRLRTTLAEYYASDEGSTAIVEIAVPKGTYIPTFTLLEEYKKETREPPGPLSHRPVAILSLVGLATALLAVWLWTGQTAEEVQVVDDPTGIPVVDIEPIEQTGNPDVDVLAAGIRYQLIHDLSYVKTVRVRDLSLLGLVDMPPEDKDNGDYRLTSALTADASAINFLLASTDSSVVWASTLSLPESDGEFYDLSKDAIGSIIIEVAGERGAVNSDTMLRLTNRADDFSESGTSDYECLVLSFAFDAIKDEGIRDRARDCLKQLIEQGSTNSSVYAQYALLLFLDWSRVGDGNPNDPMVQEALSHARQSVLLDPHNSVGFEHLGSILSALSRREEAIEAYERGLELTPWKPSLNFLLGWQIVLTGDWEKGMDLASHGVAMSPFAPGYMRIPGVMDAFRQGNYQRSYELANTVIALGDGRGYVLAYAAALAMNNPDLANQVLSAAGTSEAIDPDDPIREVRNSFSNPSVIPKYQSVLAAANSPD